jgi:hypothetical protein
MEGKNCCFRRWENENRKRIKLGKSARKKPTNVIEKSDISKKTKNKVYKQCFFL